MIFATVSMLGCSITWAPTTLYTGLSFSKFFIKPFHWNVISILELRKIMFTRWTFNKDENTRVMQIPQHKKANN